VTTHDRIAKRQRVGRPKSDVETTTITVRIPVELQARLDRYLERLERQMGLKANRSSMCGHALRLFLDAQEADNGRA
jgi:hypothetical protein